MAAAAFLHPVKAAWATGLRQMGRIGTLVQRCACAELACLLRYGSGIEWGASVWPRQPKPSGAFSSLYRRRLNPATRCLHTASFHLERAEMGRIVQITAQGEPNKTVKRQTGRYNFGLYCS